MIFNRRYSVTSKELIEIIYFSEVGIGGEYDCTNIIQNPVVTGF